MFKVGCVSTTVEMQHRLNTSTLSTLNKQADSAEVFKVGVLFFARRTLHVRPFKGGRLWASVGCVGGVVDDGEEQRPFRAGVEDAHDERAVDDKFDVHDGP